VRAYYRVEEMLKHEQLDAVSVCSAGVENGGDHFVPTMQCLEAGLHVLGEKPISNEIEKARQMVAKADEKGVYYGINLNHRFVPPAAKAKQWINEGRLGDLLLINMTMWIGNPNETLALVSHPRPCIRTRWTLCATSAATWNGFMPSSTRRRDGFATPMSKSTCTFANGVIGHLTGSYDTNPRHNLERCEVLGTKGRFVLDNLYEELTLYPRDSDELTVIRNSIMGGLSGFNATFTNRIHRFLEQVNVGAPHDQLDASGHEGLAVQEIIEAAIRSFQTGRAEEVPIG
jgi:UDP-N-acetylglucosamine 3-dehydrogenase